MYHLSDFGCHPICYLVHVKRQSRSADAVILVHALMLPHRVCRLERLKLVRGVVRPRSPSVHDRSADDDQNDQHAYGGDGGDHADRQA
jgi:hypothetical protein